MANPYTVDLERNPANHMPLTPLRLHRAALAAVHPEQLAVVHGTQRVSPGVRSMRVAAALPARFSNAASARTTRSR